jgi:lipoate---protein ligase
MMVHGEYKVPGGKLVVADLEVSGSGEDAVIIGASINGDFFLEPDEALSAGRPY